MGGCLCMKGCECVVHEGLNEGLGYIIVRTVYIPN